jgi:hypothetical protein
MKKSLNIYKIEGLIDYRSRNILNLNNSSEHIHDDESIISFLENNFENLNFNKNIMLIQERLAARLLQVIFYGFLFLIFLENQVETKNI